MFFLRASASLRETFHHKRNLPNFCSTRVPLLACPAVRIQAPQQQNPTTFAPIPGAPQQSATKVQPKNTFPGTHSNHRPRLLHLDFPQPKTKRLHAKTQRREEKHLRLSASIRGSFSFCALAPLRETLKHQPPSLKFSYSKTHANHRPTHRHRNLPRLATRPPPPRTPSPRYRSPRPRTGPLQQDAQGFFRLTPPIQPAHRPAPNALFGERLHQSREARTVANLAEKPRFSHPRLSFLTFLPSVCRLQ